MKSLLPIAPVPAAAPATDSGTRAVSNAAAESFDSVLERQLPAATPSAGPSPITGEPTAHPVITEESLPAEPAVEGSIAPPEEDGIDVAALFAAGLTWFPAATPPPPAEPTRLGLSFDSTGTDEHPKATAGSTEAGHPPTPVPPAAIRTAALPTFLSTLALEPQPSVPFPVASTPNAMPAVGQTVVSLEAPVPHSGLVDAAVTMPAPSPVEFSSLQAMAAWGGEELPGDPERQPAAPTQPQIAGPEILPENRAAIVASAPQRGESEPPLDSAAPFTVLPVVPPGIGTGAAKRGGAMQNATLPTAENPLPEHSAGSVQMVDSEGLPTPLSSSPATLLQRDEVKPARREPEATALRETRPEHAPRDPVAAVDLRTVEARSAMPVRAPREATPEAGAPVREITEASPLTSKEPGTSLEIAPAFAPHGARPEQISTAPTIAAREPARAEVAHVIEKTIDAALRLRASGQERLEVAVQLESGDRLTIQLRLANGEVTPIIRTSSDGLRSALEQNWNQFTDRAGDRGVRLTPPIFDMDRSNSNMSDLSQQRHGRDHAHAEAQAELFPHLPRRMPAPRVLSSAAFESTRAAAEGVRAYA